MFSLMAASRTFSKIQFHRMWGGLDISTGQFKKVAMQAVKRFNTI